MSTSLVKNVYETRLKTTIMRVKDEI